MIHAATYYKDYGEKYQGEINNLRYAMKPLKALYGSTSPAKFTPQALENVRQEMIDSKLARSTVNGRITRIKRLFTWAVSKEFVSPTVGYGLETIKGLKRGRSKAKETDRITTVPEADVQATCAHLNKHVRAMVQVQELAGMRPQDIMNMRTYDIDTSEDVWVYRPFTHKTEHLDHVRRIAIGPKAQAILKPFLKPGQPKAFVFSPKEAAEAVLAERRSKRKAKMIPSQRKRSRKSKPKRTPGEQYNKNSYRHAIVRACDKAEVPRWHPHQLRHNCATKVRKLYGYEAAVEVLGHKHGHVTETYAEQNFQKAIDIMREIG